MRETVTLVKTEEVALEALGVNEKQLACGIYRENGFGKPLHWVAGAV